LLSEELTGVSWQVKTMVVSACETGISKDVSDLRRFVVKKIRVKHKSMKTVIKVN